QILRNLMSNALKYTPKGGILMGCRRRGAILTILVCDSGIGVAATETKAIFDAYHQGEKVSALSGYGLGLGLSIVQRLAHLMDHPISVRSTPGKGSCFMITLPFVEASPEDLRPPQAESVLTVVERQTGTILMVEDEEPLRDLLAEVLGNEGHTGRCQGQCAGCAGMGQRRRGTTQSSADGF
ncbi:MAG: ATP-binding protein, partial [Pseudorhodobacter sp.]|nr:ATP-binding protein [Pseudorhodobacter sp.]